MRKSVYMVYADNKKEQVCRLKYPPDEEPGGRRYFHSNRDQIRILAKTPFLRNFSTISLAGLAKVRFCETRNGITVND